MSIRLYNSHIPLDPLDRHICLIDFDSWNHEIITEIRFTYPYIP
jgi:hypothetical protein